KGVDVFAEVPEEIRPARRRVVANTIRLRDKEHCKFVSRQPCVVCGRTPTNPHHLRFAQPRALGRKVSDEYTVPVCRTHHRELHGYGDEASWWAGVNVDPVPDADRIRVVMDNLSTHTAGALYETFPAPEAHRILQRLEFHYTPKHASWLNMVEIEIGVLRGQCLDRRIGERGTLTAEIEAWQRQRNASGARIKWRFTTQKARDKLARAYPNTAKES